MGLVVADSAPIPTPGVPCLFSAWILTCVVTFGRPNSLEDREAVPPFLFPPFLHGSNGGRLCTGWPPRAKQPSGGVKRVRRALRVRLRCCCAGRKARHQRYTRRKLGAAPTVEAFPTNCPRHSEKDWQTKCHHRSPRRPQRMPSSNRRPRLSCSRLCPAASCHTSTRF